MTKPALGLLALLAAACITHSPAAYPLYPNSENERPADEIGIVNGPICVIDGQDVSDHGRSFALAPGCHSFRLLAKVGDSASNGAIVMSLPQQTIRFLVQGGHVYSLDTNVNPATGPEATGSVGFVDHSSDGTVTTAERCPDL